MSEDLGVLFCTIAVFVMILLVVVLNELVSIRYKGSENILKIRIGMIVLDILLIGLSVLFLNALYRNVLVVESNKKVEIPVIDVEVETTEQSETYTVKDKSSLEIQSQGSENSISGDPDSIQIFREETGTFN